MKKKHLAIVILLIPIGLLSAQAFTFEPVKPRITSPAVAGYGGTYSAMEAGFDTLLMNPAALSWTKSSWSVARLATNVSGPLFDLPAAFQSDDLTSNLVSLIGKNKGVYIGADITGPIAFGKVDKNFGFGIFTNSKVVSNLSSVTKTTILAGEEILLTGGYGLIAYEKDKDQISVGLQMKGFFQNYLYQSGSAVDVIDSFSQMKLDTIPVVLSAGFGLDAGVIFSHADIFRIGLHCKDLFTPVFSTRFEDMDGYLSNKPNSETLTERLDPELNLGMYVQVPVPHSWVTLTSWKFMADYRDSLSIFRPLYRNPILNLALGTEVSFLDVVSLRAGIQDAYLATGLGIDLSILQIDFAIYGSELGLDPGDRPLLNMGLSVSFTY